MVIIQNQSLWTANNFQLLHENDGQHDNDAQEMLQVLKFDPARIAYMLQGCDISYHNGNHEIHFKPIVPQEDIPFDRNGKLYVLINKIDKALSENKSILFYTKAISGTKDRTTFHATIYAIPRSPGEMKAEKVDEFNFFSTRSEVI